MKIDDVLKKNKSERLIVKCFYHSADLDGHCSGAIVKMKFPDCEMIGINYGQDVNLDSVQQGEEVYMVDFCLQPFDGMIELNKKAKLHWIDHHAKGSIDEAHANGFIASGGQLLEVGKAGCELTWEYLFPDKFVPYSVFLLGRYDVWDHGADVGVLPFQYGMRNFSDTRPDNTALWGKIIGSEFEVALIKRNGAIILDYEQKQNEKFCKAYAFETDFNGLSAICANRGFTNSKLFDSAYDPRKHHLMITFCRKKLPSKQWTVSLYSTRSDVDCGDIAKSFGGGGHKGAAGFQCSELPFIV